MFLRKRAFIFFGRKNAPSFGLTTKENKMRYEKLAFKRVGSHRTDVFYTVKRTERRWCLFVKDINYRQGFLIFLPSGLSSNVFANGFSLLNKWGLLCRWVIAERLRNLVLAEIKCTHWRKYMVYVAREMVETFRMGNIHEMLLYAILPTVRYWSARYKRTV